MSPDPRFWLAIALTVLGWAAYKVEDCLRGWPSKTERQALSRSIALQKAFETHDAGQ